MLSISIIKDLIFKVKLRYVKNPILALEKLQYYFLTKPTRIKLLVKFQKYIKKPAEPEKWVFIVGCYNSGTTLLEKLIATHSQISALDEGVFKTDQLLTPEELGWTRMWYKVIEKVRLTDMDNSVDAEELKKDWGLFFNPKKSVFLEKSIVNSARMLWLQRNFKNSYFIFIVRNGYAVAEGIRRKALVGKWGMQQNFIPYYPIELCAQQWVVNNEIIEQDSKKIKNFKKIYYEELCKSPREVIKELLNFIGLQENINWHRAKKWKIHEKFSTIKNMNQRSIDNLTQDDINKINSIASDMLKFYGYYMPSKEFLSG